MIRPIVAMALLACGWCAAQESAALAGVVQDPSRSALAGVTITVVNEDTGIRRTTLSDQRGFYAFGGVAAGSYKVTARKPGFRTVVQLNVKVETGAGGGADFILPIGSVHEVVTVEGSAPLVNASDGAVGTVVGRDLIEALPLNGRGILDLLDLSAGVVATPANSGEAGQFSVNGQRPNANYFTIDGVSGNNAIGGGSSPAQFSGGSLPGMTAFGSTQNLVEMEDLQEVRVQTSSFAPEYGRLPGAQVALATRAGSNEAHGSAFHNFRNEALNANDWISNSVGAPRIPDRLSDWGGALSGAISRNRTFFFGSYEGLRLATASEWLALTPSTAARAETPPSLSPLLNGFPQPSGAAFADGTALLAARATSPASLNSGSLRVDHRLTSRVSLFGRYNQAPSTTQSGLSQITRADFRSKSLTLGATAVSSRTTIDLRFNASPTAAYSQSQLTNAGGAVPVNLASYLPLVGGSDPTLYVVAIAGVGQLISGEGPKDRQSLWNAVGTFGFNTGSHALRWGADYARISPTRESTAFSLMGNYDSLADLLAGVPMLTIEGQAQPGSSLIEILSCFIQDAWQVNRRLTLTYGTRWELTPSPSLRLQTISDAAPIPLVTPTVALDTGGVSTSGPANGSSGPGSPPGGALVWPTRYNQFEPRLGAAYRIGGRDVLRVGSGIFYDPSFSLAADPINGFPFNRWQFGSGGSTFPVSTPVYGYGFASGLRLPYALEWNLAYERTLTASAALSVSYVGSSGQRLLRREGSSQPATSVAQTVVATNQGASSYNALQVQYRRRLSRGLQAVVSYTWSHSLDNGSSDSEVDLISQELPASRDRGSSSFDARQSLSLAASYRIPALVASPYWHGILKDWSVTGLLRARSGFPIDVLLQQNPLGLGFDNVTRPDIVPGPPVWISDNTIAGGRRLNPAAFLAPDGSIQGDLGRNAIAGLGMAQFDFAVERAFPVRETAALELRMDAFNALNHPNPGDPEPYLQNSLFGRPVSMLNLALGSGSPQSGLTPAFQTGGPRVLQVTVRVRF